MEGELRWPALLSPHTTGVSWLVQLWSVGALLCSRAPWVFTPGRASLSWPRYPQREVCGIQDSLSCLWPLPAGLRMAANAEAPHSSPLSPLALT